MDYLVLEGVILSDCLKRRYSQFYSKTQTGEITDIAEAFRIKNANRGNDNVRWTDFTKTQEGSGAEAVV